MKRLLAFALACVAILSCSKLEQEDPADKFVGSYSLSVTQNVVWGADSGTLSNTGTLTISKIGSSSVSISGYFYTTGEVTENVLYIKGYSVSDSEGYLTNTFLPATLSGKVLTFSGNQTGQLKYGSKLYPFRSSDYYTAIKR